MKRINIIILIIVSMFVGGLFFKSNHTRADGYNYLQLGWTGQCYQQPDGKWLVTEDTFNPKQILAGYVLVIECNTLNGRNHGNIVARKGPQYVYEKIQDGWWGIVPESEAKQLFTDRYMNLVNTNNPDRNWLEPLPEWNWIPPDTINNNGNYTELELRPQEKSTGWIWVGTRINGFWNWVPQWESCNNPLLFINNSSTNIRIRYKNITNPPVKETFKSYPSWKSVVDIKKEYANFLGLPNTTERDKAEIDRIITVKYYPN